MINKKFNSANYVSAWCIQSSGKDQAVIAV